MNSQELARLKKLEEAQSQLSIFTQKMRYDLNQVTAKYEWLLQNNQDLKAPTDEDIKTYLANKPIEVPLAPDIIIM